MSCLLLCSCSCSCSCSAFPSDPSLMQTQHSASRHNHQPFWSGQHNSYNHRYHAYQAVRYSHSHYDIYDANHLGNVGFLTPYIPTWANLMTGSHSRAQLRRVALYAVLEQHHRLTDRATVSMASSRACYKSKSTSISRFRSDKYSVLCSLFWISMAWSRAFYVNRCTSMSNEYSP